MLNKIILFLFVFLMTVNLSLADVFQHKTSVASFIDKIPQMDSISCKFKQEKVINGVNKPLISGGNFKFIKNKGVFFETIYPIKSSSSYSIHEYKQINDIINAISNKKYKNLEDEFDFYFENLNNKWVLGLKPKSASQSSRFISSVEIQGTDFINKITIITKNQDKTTQWFTKE